MEAVAGSFKQDPVIMRRGAQRNLLLAQRAPRAASRGKSSLLDYEMEGGTL